jgi:hypothetical protein
LLCITAELVYIAHLYFEISTYRKKHKINRKQILELRYREIKTMTSKTRQAMYVKLSIHVRRVTVGAVETQ